MADILFLTDLVNEPDQPRITGSRIFRCGIAELKDTIRDLLRHSFYVREQLIRHGLIHMAHFKGGLRLARYHILLAWKNRDLPHGKDKCIIQFPGPLLCLNDQFCHAHQRVLPAVHHGRSRMVAHPLCRHIIPDNADDPADDSDIRTRSIQPAALFNMILQIAFIIFQIPSDASDNLWT